MKLTVLSVAYAFGVLNPDTAGGAEQVLGWLDRAITRAGHRSVVVARAGSKVSGHLIPVPDFDGSLDDRQTWYRSHANHRAAIAQALREWPVDLIHMHGLDFSGYLPRDCGLPILVTLHLPPAWYPPDAFRNDRPGIYFNCVSQSQRVATPAGLPVADTIPNGIPLERYRCKPRKRSFAVALGRLCPEKGFHLALDAARRARIGFLLGGELFPSRAHCDYFNREIAPRLSRSRRFVGPLRGKRKTRLIASARCILVPSQAPETSSLVAMEALACGTPVVAFNSGALPEIVEHGRTGFIVKNEREMAEAIAAAGGIDPATCREEAERRFSAERMAHHYLQLYEKLLRLPNEGRKGLANAA